MVRITGEDSTHAGDKFSRAFRGNEGGKTRGVAMVMKKFCDRLDKLTRLLYSARAQRGMNDEALQLVSTSQGFHLVKVRKRLALYDTHNAQSILPCFLRMKSVIA